VKREKKPTRCNNHMFIINFCLNMFRASLCPSSGKQRPCVTAYGVLRWFCWMWLVSVLGSCVVGCEHCSIMIEWRQIHGENLQCELFKRRKSTFQILASFLVLWEIFRNLKFRKITERNPQNCYALKKFNNLSILRMGTYNYQSDLKY
jgi:hypothetical protein